MPVVFTQPTNLIRSGVGVNGFDFNADQETLIINPLVVIESIDANGVVSGSTFEDSILRNSGFVFGDGGNGVDFSGSNARVINLAGALIHGKSFGVAMSGSGSQIVNNNGTIIGGQLGAIDFTASGSMLLDNHGYISGRIEVTSASVGGTVNNFGLIKATGNAFYLFPAAGLTTVINNAATGTIASTDPGANAIFTKTGMLSLNNAGKIVGNILDSPGLHDSIVNSGTINGSIFLGGGDDVYRGVGNGRVTGGIHGDAGKDTFVADKARESFLGDANADSFVFASVLFSPATAQRDTIGFSHSDLDKINVHAIDADTTHAGNQNFAFIGTDSFAHYHSVHPGVVGMLRFAPVSHRVQGNVNGDFAHADFEVNLPGVTTLQASDFVL